MKFPIFGWSTSSTASTTVTTYSIVTNYNFGGGTDGTIREQVLPVAMTLRNLYITVSSGSAPGIGKSWTCTIEKNGVATALTATISGAAYEASNTSDVITFQPGDTVRLAITPSGTPSANFPQWTLLGETLGSSCQPFFVTIPGNHSNTIAGYMSPLGGSYRTTSPGVNMVMPCSGIFTRVRADIRDAPGSGKSWELALNLNGTNTALSTTLIDATVSQTNTTDQIRVVAGDVVVLALTPSGTPTSTGGTYSVLFTPDIKGESIMSFISQMSPSNSTTVYNPAFGAFSSTSPTWDANESLYYLRAGFPGAATITSLFLRTGSAPGSGKSFTFKIRKSATDTAATATVADLAKTGNITGLNIPIATNDQLSMSSTPSGTPTTSSIAYGYTLRFPDSNNWSM